MCFKKYFFKTYFCFKIFLCLFKSMITQTDVQTEMGLRNGNEKGRAEAKKQNRKASR